MRRISTDEGAGSGANLFESFGGRISEMRRNTIDEAFEFGLGGPEQSRPEQLPEGIFLRRYFFRFSSDTLRQLHTYIHMQRPVLKLINFKWNFILEIIRLGIM
jgi:hypothetical protein